MLFSPQILIRRPPARVVAAGGGTFSFISGVSTITGGSGGGATAAIDTTGAGLLIAVTNFYFAASGMTVTDNKSNSWTALTSSVGSASGCNIWYSVPTSVGSGHTASLGGTNVFGACIFAAFSGGAATPFDQEAQQSGTAPGAGTISTASITPGFNNELVIFGGSAAEDTSSLVTPSGGFTIIDNAEAGVSGVNVSGSAAYLIQTSAAAANPTWTINGNFNWATKLASFKVS